MKYTVDIIIEKPIDQVVEFFENPDNKYLWMEGLESFEHLTGTQGQSGSTSKMKFILGNRKVEMVETITLNNLPEEFCGTYEANGVLNIQKNKFIKVSDCETKYISENEFKLKGFMKLIGLLMPFSFKNQTKKYLSNFKNSVENGK
jgi:uncharacterized membrane protein